MKKCTHTEIIPGKWVYPLHGVPYWVDQRAVPTTATMDANRYRCYQCGSIFYNSPEAKQRHLNGETKP